MLAWGNFITIALNFAILAFIIFLMVKQINRLKSEAPPPAARRPARGRPAPARDPRQPEEVGLAAPPLARLRPGRHRHAGGDLRREPGEARLASLAVEQVVEIRESPAAPAVLPASPGRPVSFSDAARKAVPSVVNISATKQVRRRNPAARRPGPAPLLRRALQRPGDPALARLRRDREPRGLRPHQFARRRRRDRDPGDPQRRPHRPRAGSWARTRRRTSPSCASRPPGSRRSPSASPTRCASATSCSRSATRSASARPSPWAS